MSLLRRLCSRHNLPWCLLSLLSWLMVGVLVWDTATAPAPQPAWHWAPDTGLTMAAPGGPIPLAGLRLPNGAITEASPRWHALAPETQRTLPDLQAFFQTEGWLWSLRGQSLHFVDVDGQLWPVRWSTLGTAVLTHMNWALISMALFTWHLALWNWRQRPRDRLVAIYAIGGLAYAASLLVRAWVSARPWAVPGWSMAAVFHVSHLMGYMLLGGCLFVAMRLPQRLIPLALERVIVAAILALCVLDQLQASPTMLFATYQYPVVLMTCAIVLLEVWLGFKLRHDPTYRAALRWLFMAFALSAGPGVLFYAFWAMGWMDLGINHSANLMAPALGYYGISALLHREQLFRLENLRSGALAWWIALLAALAVLLGLSTHGGSLVSWAPLVSLLTLPWVYLAARRWLDRRAPLTAAERLEQLVPQLMNMAAAESRSGHTRQHWHDILSAAFQPERLSVGTTASSSPCDIAILEGGVCLRVPELDGQAGPAEPPPLLLHGAQGGARLFNPTDIQLAETLWRLASQGVLAHQSYTLGAHAERRRIAADLHDDIGGKLLHLSQAAADPQMRHYALNTLGDLRNITRGLSAQHRSWRDAMADLRHQLTRRLEAIDVDLNWQITWTEALLNQPAPAEVAVSISCIASELVRNALEHAQAPQLRMLWQQHGDQLTLSLVHSGQVTDPQRWQPGLGVNSIRRRVGELGGQCRWVREADSGELHFDASWPAAACAATSQPANASRGLGIAGHTA